MNSIHKLPDEPPLRAVRTFEAFARTGIIADAAAELGITASAVSHQLKLLEQYLQTDLTTRQGRKLVLTQEGRDYYRSIRSAFSVLRSASHHIRDRTNVQHVELSLIPLFGLAWFIPRLPMFLQEHPDVGVQVSYANHRNYLSDAADLSVRFGAGHWQGYRSFKLMPGAMIATGTPALARRHAPLDDPRKLASLPLIHDEDRNSWTQWLHSIGAENTAPHAGPLFEDGLLTLHGALSELGFALLREPLIEKELRNGALIKLFDATLDDGRDYYLCYREDVELSRGETALRDWLIAQSRYLDSEFPRNHAN